MHIINLTPLEPGVYCDHSSDSITTLPNGWAMIPEDFELPSTFPRCGMVEAEEIAHTYEVEVEKEVVKTREIESIDENGEPVIIAEEYTETEMVSEQRERVIMTVTKMTEGVEPEPVEPEPTPMEVLQQENKLLKAQVSALSANQEFLEDCLIEVGQVIYA